MAESTIITGQFVRISQVPASIGERILAWIFDVIILISYCIFTSNVLSQMNFFDSLGDQFAILSIIIFYLPIVCYSLLWEIFNNGQSPGKSLVKIRVIKADGTTPTLSSYFLRWLLFSIDVIVTGGLGLIVAILTKNNQRLGDLAAGTIVIKEKNYTKIQVSLDEFNHLSVNYRPIYPQAQDLSLEQVNVINKTLDMKYGKQRDAHIQQLSAKIRHLLSIHPSRTDDEQLLNTLIRDYQFYSMEI